MQNLVSGLQGPDAVEKQGACTARNFFLTARTLPIRFSLLTAICIFFFYARAAAMQKLEELQVKDTLRMINNMVELCFSECVTGFRSKVLTGSEEKCVNTCAEKFLKHSGRVGQRFGELWMAEQQAAANAAGGAAGPS